jgi:hypothetical protein
MASVAVEDVAEAAEVTVRVDTVVAMPAREERRVVLQESLRRRSVVALAVDAVLLPLHHKVLLYQTPTVGDHKVSISAFIGTRALLCS